MNSAEPVLSVIIPAYNAGATLLKALEAVRDLDEVEVIVVENGSTDDTYEKANQVSDIVVYRSAKGVSNARNLGLQNAHGKWIAFLDADDAYTKEGIARMLRHAKEDLYDLYVYGHLAKEQVRSVTQSDQVFVSDRVLQAQVEMISNPTKYMQAWGKLFRKEIIDTYGIRFNPQMRFSEDSDFTLQYLKRCGSVFLSSENVYRYTLNTGSVMRVFDGTKAKAYTEAMECSAEHVEGEPLEIRNAFWKYVLMHLNVLMVREVFDRHNPASHRERIKMEKEIADKPIFRQAMQVLRRTDYKNVRFLPGCLLKDGHYQLAGFMFSLRAAMNARKEK